MGMEDARQLRVTGEGSQDATPDRWVLVAAVNALAGSAADALNEVTEKVTSANRILTDEGVPGNSIRTKNLLLNDWFDQAQQRVTARVASHEFEVTVDDLEQLKSMISSLTAEVGENLQLRGLRATVSDPEPLYEEAQREAVSNARAKAQNLAHSAGVLLGRILSIEEQRTLGGQVQPMSMAAAFRPTSLPAVPIEPGTLSVRAVVSIVYEIK